MVESYYTWRILSPDNIQTFLRAIRHMSTIDEWITIVVRKKRLDLVSQSDQSDSAIICGFRQEFFSEFQGPSYLKIGILARHLILITERHKTSIVNLQFTLRHAGYIDVQIDYNTGVNASHGCPLQDHAHDLCDYGGPEIPEFEPWMGGRWEMWEERILKLYPGVMESFAFKMRTAGLETRNFDCEKNRTQTFEQPIFLSAQKLETWKPERSVEVTDLPFKKFKLFVETAKKCKFNSLTMIPHIAEGTSQCTFQAMPTNKNVMFTLLLACNVEYLEEEDEGNELEYFKSLK